MGHYASEMPSMEEMHEGMRRVQAMRDERIYARLRFHRDPLVRAAKDRREYGQIQQWLNAGLTYDEILVLLELRAPGVSGEATT